MGSTPAPSQCLEQHYWDTDRSKNETRLKCHKNRKLFKATSPTRIHITLPLPGLCATLHLDYMDIWR